MDKGSKLGVFEAVSASSVSFRSRGGGAGEDVLEMSSAAAEASAARVPDGGAPLTT